MFCSDSVDIIVWVRYFIGLVPRVGDVEGSADGDVVGEAVGTVVGSGVGQPRGLGFGQKMKELVGSGSFGGRGWAHLARNEEGNKKVNSARRRKGQISSVNKDLS